MADDTAEEEVPFLLTADELAAYLRVSRSWVYEAARNGSIPCIRVGALKRFDYDEVKAVLSGEKAMPSRVVRMR